MIHIGLNLNLNIKMPILFISFLRPRIFANLDAKQYKNYVCSCRTGIVLSLIELRRFLFISIVFILGIRAELPPSTAFIQPAPQS